MNNIVYQDNQSALSMDEKWEELLYCKFKTYKYQVIFVKEVLDKGEVKI